MKMRKQRLMGLAMLVITALILVMARGGKTPEDSDATAALLAGPLGLYMLLSKTYILYEDKEPKEATEASRSGEATPRAYINKHRKEGAYAEDVRVKNKIIRETRKEGLLLLNDDIDLEDVQGELETRAKFMFVPLQRMIDAKEISSAEITVPEGQAETILEDETMRVKIRYVSRGYIREVEVDLGRAQPSE